MKKQLSKFCSILLSATLLISTSFIATGAKTIRADGDWIEISGEQSSADLFVEDYSNFTRKFILTGDVTMTDGFCPQYATTIQLDLNGHTLSDTSDKNAVVTVKTSQYGPASLYITDSSYGLGRIVGAEDKGCIFVDVNCEVHITDGVTLQGATNRTAVFVNQSATFTMTGGAIAENESLTKCPSNIGGAAVYGEMDSTITIDGTLIADNSCGNYPGGAICTIGKLALINATITNNTTTADGGALYLANPGNVKITNCTFTGNSASMGGAICWGGGNLDLDTVTITGNTASQKGSGIFYSYSAGSKEDLDINGEITIINNTGDNVYLEKDECHFCESEKVTGTIGVTSGALGGETTSVNISRNYINLEDYRYFVSDDSNYVVEYRGHNGGAFLSVPSNNESLIASKALSFTHSIGLVFNIAIPEESQIDSTEFYYSIDGGNWKTIAFADATVFDAANGIYSFTVPVNVAQLTAPIETGILFQTGECIIKDFQPTTVKDVAEDYLTGNYDAKTQSVVRALLLYGGCAQRQFKVNTSDYADAGIAAITSEETAKVDTYLTGCVPGYVDSADSDIRYYGSTMFFLNDNTLRHYFYVTGDISDYTFEYNGKTKNGSEIGRVGTSNFYYIQIAGLSPADMKTEFSVVVKKGSTEVISFEYSAQNYLAKILDASNNADMKALASAAALYFDAVEKYGQN